MAHRPLIVRAGALLALLGALFTLAFSASTSQAALLPNLLPGVLGPADSPVDPAAARRAGIHIRSFIGTDDRAAGELAARAMAAKLRGGGAVAAERLLHHGRRGRRLVRLLRPGQVRSAGEADEIVLLDRGGAAGAGEGRQDVLRRRQCG